jgi:hypothetical protein
MQTSVVRALVVAALLLPKVAGAQVFSVGKEQNTGGPRRSPVTGGLAFVYGQPTGVFRDFVKQGIGVDGNAHYKLDRAGIISLGVEGGFLTYGRETNRVPLSSSIGGRILVDVTTSNNIVWLGLGPQLAVPSGPIRPYVSGTAGFSYFFTESSVEGSTSSIEFAKTTNYDDATFALTGGGGFLIPVGRSGGALDIGVRYHGNGNVRYLRKGSYEEDNNGGITFFPIESKAPLVSWRIGFRGGLR